MPSRQSDLHFDPLPSVERMLTRWEGCLETEEDAQKEIQGGRLFFDLEQQGDSFHSMLTVTATLCRESIVVPPSRSR